MQVFKKLEIAYDQTIHPQKRLDMKGALEACMGRMLEVKHWLVRTGLSATLHSTASYGLRELGHASFMPFIAAQVKLNRGLDFSSMDDVLVDMKLAPEVLELPCPAYFRDDRAKV